MSKLRIKRGFAFKVQPGEKSKQERVAASYGMTAQFFESNGTVSVNGEGPYDVSQASFQNIPVGEVHGVISGRVSGRDRTMPITGDYDPDTGILSLSREQAESMTIRSEMHPPPLIYTNGEGETYRVYPETLDMGYCSTAMELNIEANRLLKEVEPVFNEEEHPTPAFLLEQDHILKLAHEATVYKTQMQAWIGRFMLMGGLAFTAFVAFVVQFWGR